MEEKSILRKIDKPIYYRIFAGIFWMIAIVMFLFDILGLKENKNIWVILASFLTLGVLLYEHRYNKKKEQMNH